MLKVVALNEEQRKLVEENIKLVPYLLKDLYIQQSEYDEMISAGNLGLINAASTYDASSNIKFSSYASVCIKNKFYTRIGEIKKNSREISYDSIIQDTDEKDEGISFESAVLVDPGEVGKGIEERETVKNILETILNMDRLSLREKRIVFYRLSGMKPCKINEIFNVSQSLGSMISSNAYKKIAKQLKQNLECPKKIKVDITLNQYKVNIIFEDDAQRKEKYQKLMEMVTYTDGFPNYTVECNDETITVNFAAEQESFLEIAKILFIFESYEKKTKKRYYKRKNRKNEEIYLFMNERGTFTTKEVKAQFPNKTERFILKFLSNESRKGVITRLKRGKYKMNEK